MSLNKMLKKMANPCYFYSMVCQAYQLRLRKLY